jgi:hypothetical protein
MIMVGHETISVNHKRKKLMGSLDIFEEFFLIPSSFEYGFSTISATDNMIKSA